MSSQPPSQSQPQDQPMTDAATNGEPFIQTPIEIGEQRIRVLPGASETAASFEFEGEDHTLGNALRYMIMKKYGNDMYLYRHQTCLYYASPEVEFCGYSIPHPSEAKMNVRIQTYDGTTVYEALEKGFDDLADLCVVVEEKFTAAKDRFMEVSS